MKLTAAHLIAFVEGWISSIKLELANHKTEVKVVNRKTESEDLQ